MKAAKPASVKAASPAGMKAASPAGMQPGPQRPKPEAKVEKDEVSVFEDRLAKAKQNANAVPIFESAVAQFPMAPKFWRDYAEYQETRDVGQTLSIFQRAVPLCPSADLWTSYIAFCKRCQPLEDTMRVYQKALDAIGTDWRVGSVWSEYIALLKRSYNCKVAKIKLIEDPNPIEVTRREIKPESRKAEVDKNERLKIDEKAFAAVASALSVDEVFIRSVYHRALTTPHSLLDRIWDDYQQFEKSMDAKVVEERVAECKEWCDRSKDLLKEVKILYSSVEQPVVAMPPEKQNQKRVLEKVAAWKKIFQFERANKLHLSREQLQVRVTLAHEQARVTCAYQPDFWFDFASWLDTNDLQEKAIQVLVQAVDRYLPGDMTLRLFLAQLKEFAEMQDPPAAGAPQPQGGADDTYRALLDDFAKAVPPMPCPLALIHYLAYVRRSRGENDFRDLFLEATVSSIHCLSAVYIFVALTEFYVFKRTDLANRSFRMAIERFGDREPSLRVAYVNYLTGRGDLYNARAELARGVTEMLQVGVRDQMANRNDPGTKQSLSFLWQKWVRLETHFGDSDAILKATSFRDLEYQSLQRDQDMEEEQICKTPDALGLATSLAELEESYSFQQVVAAQPNRDESMAAAATPKAPQPQARSVLHDQAVSDSLEEHKRLASQQQANLSALISRPNVGKMKPFRPVVEQEQRASYGTATEAAAVTSEALPAKKMPKCLQDLLDCLPKRPLKGAKPDVDYLLTVLQTVTIPKVPVKEIDNERIARVKAAIKREGETEQEVGQDSGRPLAKGEEEVAAGSFFATRPTLYRERILVKRQRIHNQMAS